MTRKKYPIYTIDPKSKTVKVRFGRYAVGGAEYRFALYKDSDGAIRTVDVWTGYELLPPQHGKPEKAVYDDVLAVMDRIIMLYRLDDQRYRHDGVSLFVFYNRMLRATIPPKPECDIPKDIYDYIFSPALFGGPIYKED